MTNLINSSRSIFESSYNVVPGRLTRDGEDLVACLREPLVADGPETPLEVWPFVGFEGPGSGGRSGETEELESCSV